MHLSIKLLTEDLLNWLQSGAGVAGRRGLPHWLGRQGAQAGGCQGNGPSAVGMRAHQPAGDSLLQPGEGAFLQPPGTCSGIPIRDELKLKGISHSRKTSPRGLPVLAGGQAGDRS